LIVFIKIKYIKMPRGGGQGKGKPKKGGENIGRALIKMHLSGAGKL
jgi:hypothetical protein